MKEYFGISSRKEWSAFIDYLYLNKEKLKIKDEFLDNLIIEKTNDGEITL